MPVAHRPGVTLNYQLMAPRIPASLARLPVVMVHGLGANHAFWYVTAMRHLSDRVLLMPDLRGHGRSSMPASDYGLETMAADVAACMEDAGIGRAHLVGHSHGARVALLLAQRNPERIASLTVADTQLRALQPPVRLADWPHWPEWKAELTAQGVEDLPSEDAEIDFRLLRSLGQRGGAALASGRMEDEAGGERPLRRRLGAAGGGRAAAGPARRPRGGIDLRSRKMGRRGGAQWKTLTETTTAGVEMHDETDIDIERLSELPMPVLLAYGAKSHCLPTSELLMDRIPGARRVVVPDAGHFFPIVKPRFFALALRTFVAGVETPGRAHSRREDARRSGRPVLRGALLRRRRGRPGAL